ncbi:HupE/UreJ family protein [Rubrivivax sp. A210]|uniref:HupE/UreJ family protein n=1 Tax=Rubrivivax sp. A210 TaxID=2772301 RepID=UPI00191A9E1A
MVRALWWCLLLTAGAALAHKPSDSYLKLTVSEGRLSGRWDIALRDLDFAIGLDGDGDGAITWGELRARHAEIAGYAASRIKLTLDGQPCALQVGPQQVDSHTDGAYSVLPLALGCVAARGDARLDVEYALFAELDPQHRGLLALTVEGATRTAILGPQAPRQSFELKSANRLAQLADFVRDGVWHIWIGFDHILFLLALLLPGVGHWPLRGQGWRPVTRFRQAFWDVVRVVTAFTLAHSITLSLATLGLVSLPSRWVESSIAASVVLAALNNVWPVFHRGRWMVAFAFGLIHGFGFASVLGDLGLPQGALVLALLGFNVGVECGQLVIVAAFLPLAYTLRHGAFYRIGVLRLGSLLIAAVAAAWLVERVFDLKLMPF